MASDRAAPLLLAGGCLLGTVSALQLPELPGLGVTGALALGGALLLARRPLHPLAAVLLAAAWVLMHGHWTLDSRLSPALEGEDLVIEGRVADLPDSNARRSRFVLEDVRIVEPETARPLRRLRLNWYGPRARPGPGERWRLPVRLKRPRGLANPAGFDHETWLFRQRVDATGYVREGDQTGMRLRGPEGLHAFRARLGELIDETLGDHARVPVIRALTIGDRQGLDDKTWAVLRDTGTTHLMAISGLHVGALAGLAFYAGRGAGRRAAWSPRMLAAPRIGALAALSAAVIYAALAGFAIPTQRALLMTAVVMVGMLLGRHLVPSRILAYALIGVLVLDPLAPLAPGFWLSFGAVGVIVLAMHGRHGRNWHAQLLGRVHWVVAVGLTPLLFLHFGAASLISPLANLVAVPAVTLGVVPAALAGTFLGPVIPGAAEIGLASAAMAMDWVWRWLELMAQVPLATWSRAAPPVWSVVLAAGCLIWLLAPRGIPARWVGLFGLLPALTLSAGPAPPPPGTAELTLFDVGNGRSLLVRTAAHAGLVDTGPRFSGSRNAGESIVAPYLEQLNRGQVDRILLTGTEGAQTGGLEGLGEHIATRQVIGPSGLQEFSAEPCLPGMGWDWDGVRLELMPQGADTCHVRVVAGGQELWIPGAAPNLTALREHWPAAPAVVVVPERGAGSEENMRLARELRPDIALVPVAHGDPWGRPDKRLLDAYRSAGGTVWRTDLDGAIRLTLSQDGVEIGYRHRAHAARFWHERTSSAATAREPR